MVCKSHGEYEAKLLLVQPEHWSNCPVCNSEILARRAGGDERSRLKRLEENLREAGILKRFQDATFDTYRPRNSVQAQILQDVRDYAKNFKNHLAAGRCLAILGGPGLGKTHLGVAMLKEVIGQGYKARYAREYNFFQAMKETFGGGRDKRTEREIIQEYVAPDLLVLDEIGVQFFTRAEETLIFQVIENRYGEVKPTVIISNLAAPIQNKRRDGDGQPKDRSQVKDVEDALGFRSFDRMIQGGGIMLTFPDGQPSHRRQEKLLN
jgi:DNA replication protein DnaC